MASENFIWSPLESSYHSYQANQPNDSQTFYSINDILNTGQQFESSSQGINAHQNQISNSFLRGYQNQNATQQNSYFNSQENGEAIDVQYRFNTPKNHQCNQTSTIAGQSSGLEYFSSIEQGQQNNFNTTNTHASRNFNTVQNLPNRLTRSKTTFNNNARITPANSITEINRRFFNYDLFIKEVRKHECIWNETREGYNNEELREITWKYILQNMLVTVHLFKLAHRSLTCDEQVNGLKQEWKFIMYNFKECKLNRKQSDLKEPPKCDFYKALSFMDSIITVGNGNVVKYPDIPDIRILFNIGMETSKWKMVNILIVDNFICSCSSGNYRENEKQENKDDDMSDDSDSKISLIKENIRFYLRYGQLIKQVQKHECIWNENNEEYDNKESRKRAWENVWKDVTGHGWLQYLTKNIRKCNINDVVMILEQEWKFIMYNFKECKLNRRQSDLKEPPKCEFYKALSFMDSIIKVRNNDVMKYPDVPDVRVLFNTQIEERKHDLSLFLHCCRMNNFRCKCSSWRRYADLEDGANEISEKRISQPSFGENNICIDNNNTSIDAPIGQTEKSSLTVRILQNTETSLSPNDVDQTPQHKISTQEHHTTDSDVKFSLIKQVEKQPCIWNPKHAHYKNRKKTKETWEEIRKIVKTPDNVSLKDIWKTLREDFKRCHERRNKKKEASCNFYKELKFLTDVVIKNPNPGGELTLTANKNAIRGEKVPRGLQANLSSLPKAIHSHHTSLYSDDTISSTGVDFDKTSPNDVPVFCLSDDNNDMETRHVQNADQESKSLVAEQTSSLPLTNKHDNQRGNVSCQSYQNTKEHISAGLTSSISIGQADSERILLPCNNVPTTSSDFPKMSRKHLTENTPCFSDEPDSNPIHQQNLSAINRLPARSGASNTEHSTASTTFDDMDPAYSDSNNPNNLSSTSTPAITGSSSISSEDNDEITNEKFKSDNLPQKYSTTNKQKRNSHPRRKRKRTEIEYVRTKRASAQISNTAETKNPLASELVKSLESNEKDLLFFKQVEGQLSQFSDKQKAVAKILMQKALNKVEFMDNEQLHQTLNTI
ncbi:uncharacterized protein [Clytia hemisphaerica]|uniref:MADF domain-containing protein n=2 Tax=Clytia hemisphaerica TaxID=252671 RepID=A0A7M5UXH6_9CNID